MCLSQNYHNSIKLVEYEEKSNWEGREGDSRNEAGSNRERLEMLKLGICRRYTELRG